MDSTGYEDIEKLTNQQSAMLDSALEKQNSITNQQTEMNVAQLEKNKSDLDKEAVKTNSALYAEYKKASNPYGSNAEQLYSQGLGKSGYAESTQTNLYNTYQRNVADTLNTTKELKTDIDFQISQARTQGSITQAQNALDIYRQKMQLLTQEYELKQNREQFLYQQERDKVSDNQWEKQYKYQQERDRISDNHWQQTYDYNKDRDAISDSQWQQSFDYNKNRDAINDNQWQKTFDYNKSRDKISDSQWSKTFNYQKQQDKLAQSNWEKEYQLSKKKVASSSKQSYQIRTGDVNDEANNDTSSVKIKNNGQEYTQKEILSNVKMIQGPGVKNIVKDGISGKSFSSIDELMNYYGYQVIS